MKYFPIRLDTQISRMPWSMLEEHREQVGLNYGGKTLEDLAALDGFTPEEALAILEDRPFEMMAMTAATLMLKKRIDEWCGINVPAITRHDGPTTVDDINWAINWPKDPKPRLVHSFDRGALVTRAEEVSRRMERLRDGKLAPARHHFNEAIMVLEQLISAVKQ